MRRLAIINAFIWPVLLLLLVPSGHAGTFIPEADTGSSESSRVVEGAVQSSQSFWRAGRIVTRSVLHTDDGGELTVEQIGGSVGEVSMVQFPSAPIPRVGDRVALLVADTGTEDVARPLRAPDVIDVIDVQPGGKLLTAAGDPTMKYHRTTNGWSVPLYWASGCVFITYDAAGTSHIPGDDEFAIMEQVFDTWRQAFGSCSYLTFETGDRSDTGVDGRDFINFITFLGDEWGPDGCSTDPGIVCYNPNAAAITTVSYLNTKAGENRAGEIIDADIEFNAVHFAISANDATEADPGLCKSDLANTLTHEVGHLMGLDHTCVANGYSPGLDPDGNPKPWPLDDNGDEVPYCSENDLAQEIIDSTMNAFQSCGETTKATPEADDIDGVCGVYPLAEDPEVCALPEPIGGKRTCACRVGTADNGSPVAPLIPLLLLGLVLVRARSRRHG